MVRHEVTVHETLGITDFIPIVRGRTDMADVYIKEAGRCVKEAREAFGNSLNADGEDRADALVKEKQKSLYTIMFSVFALEAHINRIGHDKLNNGLWNEFERTRLTQKWIIFPNLISGRTFDTNSTLFKNFRHVVNLRNYLVHFKDYEYKEFVAHPCGDDVVGTYEKVNVKNAELAYNTANGMMEELATILKK